MSNHFHVLVEVPTVPEGGVDDEALLKKLSMVYSPEMVGVIREQLEALSGPGATEEGRKAYEELRQRYFRRMWDLGEFMKALKQLICSRSAQALRTGLSSSGKPPSVELRYAA